MRRIKVRTLRVNYKKATGTAFELNGYRQSTTMKFPKFKTRKSAQMGAAIIYPSFIVAAGLIFFSMPEWQTDILVIDLVFACIFLVFIWLFSLQYVKAIMTKGRPDTVAIVWFALSFLTFLICQIFIFAIMYKATGLTSTRPTDNIAYLYFSVITLTTVGYGDITPTDAGRIVAMIQSLSGYIYMGVFIGIITSSIMSVNQDNNSVDTNSTF